MRLQTWNDTLEDGTTTTTLHRFLFERDTYFLSMIFVYILYALGALLWWQADGFQVRRSHEKIIQTFNNGAFPFCVRQVKTHHNIHVGVRSGTIFSPSSAYMPVNSRNGLGIVGGELARPFTNSQKPKWNVSLAVRMPCAATNPYIRIRTCWCRVRWVERGT